MLVSHSSRLVGLAATVALCLQPSAQAQIALSQLDRPESGTREFFGNALSCDESTLLATTIHAVEVFEVSGDGASWLQRIEVADVASQGVEPFAFYEPVVRGDWFVANDPSAKVGSSFGAGAAYLFHRGQGVWSHAQTLLPTQPVSQGKFGSCIDFDGTTLVVGSPREDSKRGAAHVYELQAGSWSHVQTLSGIDANGEFGSGVRVDGPWMIVGASHESGGGPKGKLHFFERAGPDPLAPWVLRQSFEGPGDWLSSWFGFHLELNVPHAAASDSGDPSIGYSPSLGVVTYELAVDGTWHETGLLLEPEVGLYGASTLFFGSALNLRGDELLIGSPFFTDAQNEGAVFRYRHEGAGWTFAGKVVPSTPEVEGRLGMALARSAESIFVSAPWTDPTCGPSPFGGPDVCMATGAVHVFGAADDSIQICSCPSAAPCGNTDQHGGCANSTGLGAVLAAAGSGSLALDDLELQAWTLPSDARLLLLVGDTSASLPFGDGHLCVGGAALRLASAPANARGLAHFGVGLLGSVAAAGHPTSPGSSYAFQVLYRDPTGPCGGGTNLTNAVGIHLGP